jgi:hypothetical protein
MRCIPCFEISRGTVAAGIPLVDNRIQVGERGRGCACVDVTLPAGSAIEADRAMSIPVTDPDAVAVVLISDHSGYRGGWQLRVAPTMLCADAAHGDPDAPGTRCPSCDGPLLAPPRPMPRDPIEAKTLGRVIATGRRAQGAAGHMGGGPEYLIAALPGRFAIARTGRLYGEPAVVTVEIDADGTVRAYGAQEALEAAAAAAKW